jgi:hypothetical protein
MSDRLALANAIEERLDATVKAQPNAIMLRLGTLMAFDISASSALSNRLMAMSSSGPPSSR